VREFYGVVYCVSWGAHLAGLSSCDFETETLLSDLILELIEEVFII